jgi:hypothetical protein
LHWVCIVFGNEAIFTVLINIGGPSILQCLLQLHFQCFVVFIIEIFNMFG